MNLLLIIFLSIITPGTECQKSETNKLYLAVKNQLYFDSSQLRIQAVLPGESMKISVNPGFLEIYVYKAGAGLFTIKTDKGDKLIKYEAALLPESKAAAQKILAEKRGLILN